MSEKSENRGVVYIVQNVLFPTYIKIGSATTKRFEQRMKELSGTNIPVPYERLFAAEINDYKEIEKSLHSVIGFKRIEGKEFFEFEDEDILNEIVISFKNLIKKQVGFKDVTNKGGKYGTKEQKSYLKKEKRKRIRIRENFNFKMLDIPREAELISTLDDDIKCKVVGDKKVLFEGEEQTLSKAAMTVLRQKGRQWGTVSGPNCWKYEGKNLTDRRWRMELKDL